MLLTFLFFYDIFFVFGSDVMLTVAKNIDAPIKLLFPTEWDALDAETGEPKPKYSLLGLGDIVIPGVFISLALRFDVIKTLPKKVNQMMDSGKAEEVLEILRKNAVTAPKHYFIGTIIGYFLAIIATVVVMLIFDHGQPALLYLVPGVLLSVVFIALAKGELKMMWEFSEERFTNDPKALEEKEKKKAGNKRKVTYESKKEKEQ